MFLLLSYKQEPWRRQWQPTPVLLPGKSHGRGSLLGYSPWGRKEWDTTEWLCFHFSLLCFGEANGIPLQCSCLENPRDGGAWWAAIYGVTQSQTRLSSSKQKPIREKVLFLDKLYFDLINCKFIIIQSFLFLMVVFLFWLLIITTHLYLENTDDLHF